MHREVAAEKEFVDFRDGEFFELYEGIGAGFTPFVFALFGAYAVEKDSDGAAAEGGEGKLDFGDIVLGGGLWDVGEPVVATVIFEEL